MGSQSVESPRPRLLPISALQWSGRTPAQPPAGVRPQELVCLRYTVPVNRLHKQIKHLEAFALTLTGCSLTWRTVAAAVFCTVGFPRLLA